MSFCVKDDLMGNTSYGKAALAKLKSIPGFNPTQNFRVYEAGWLGNTDTMQVTAAEFREAKSGPNKGKLTKIVEGTIQTVYVNQAEMAVFN